MQRTTALLRLIAMDVPRYLLAHLLAGCIAGAVAAVGLVATNLGALGDLIRDSDGGWLAFALLLFGCVATFGSVATGHAIMTIGDGED